MPFDSERTKKLPILKFFSYTHLPEHLQQYSSPFYEVAGLMTDDLEHVANIAELAAGLRKLLEAKDCFVRSMLP